MNSGLEKSVLFTLQSAKTKQNIIKYYKKRPKNLQMHKNTATGTIKTKKMLVESESSPCTFFPGHVFPVAKDKDTMKIQLRETFPKISKI